MKLQNLIAIGVLASSALSGVAVADNNAVFEESYWKANLVSIAGKSAVFTGTTTFVAARPGPYDFLTQYNP
jgi:hypothetical protein